MVILYKDPKGEKIFDRRQSQGTLNATVIEDTKIDDLEKHCSDLESRLGKYEVRNKILNKILLFKCLFHFH